MEDELHFPFEAMVMGERLQVIGMDSERSTLYGGMMVIVAKKQAACAFPLTELDASELEEDNAALTELDASELEEDNAAWVAAYQLWDR